MSLNASLTPGALEASQIPSPQMPDGELVGLAAPAGRDLGFPQGFLQASFGAH